VFQRRWRSGRRETGQARYAVGGAVTPSGEAFVTATLFYAWRPGVLGPLLAGLAVYLPLRLGLGW